MDSGITISSPANMVYTVTFGVFALFMALEALAPRRGESQGLAWRWCNNFSLGLRNWYLLTAASTALVLWLSAWTREHDIGLLTAFAAPAWVGFLLLLTGTQFLSYWVHRAFHEVSWLWPIHAVHHSDTEMDVSTSYRHHPLEPLMTLPLSAPVVLALGPSMEAVAAYKIFAVAATVFSHSNLWLPQKVDALLRPILLTPDYHRTHHSADVHYTNSNYGSLVPWFDYLFGTAKRQPFDEHARMTVGLEYLREARDTRLDRLLRTPLDVPGTLRDRRRTADSPGT